MLSGLPATERIQWAKREFGDGLVVTTSFGTYSAVMLHLISRLNLDIPIISIDTGHNEETRQFAEALIHRLGIKVARYAITPPDQEPSPAVETLDEYLKRVKIDTLENALAEHHAKVWMSGIMKSETEHRRQFEILMQREDGLNKFHPILDWSTKELYTYCTAYDLPVNDHYHDLLKGKDQDKECGIHLTGMANESYTSSFL